MHHDMCVVPSSSDESDGCCREADQRIVDDGQPQAAAPEFFPAILSAIQPEHLKPFCILRCQGCPTLNIEHQTLHES